MLRDYASAPIDEKLRATLALLEKMTLNHESLQTSDVQQVMRAGVSKRAIEDALEVAYLFNIYDRLADTMGWDVPAEESGYYAVAARRLLKHGYL